MLTLTNVKKSYKGIAAVNGLSLSMHEGEIYGIVGANGAGKSTTLAMIATLIKPDDGQIHYKDIDVVKNPEMIQRVLGYVPQEVTLYESLTGLDNLEFWGRAYHLKKEVLKKQIKNVCEIIGLSKETLSRKVSGYSGGMKRRLNIGVALLHNPELIILDEPTVGIDIESRNVILDAVKRLKENHRTILYVSHYMEEMESICDRISVLREGKCIYEGPLCEALNKSGTTISLEQFYVSMRNN